MAENKVRIPDASLENVVGGVRRTVWNDAAGYDYANVRDGAGLDSDVIFRVYNGTDVYTTGNKITRDGYTWYEIYVEGEYDYGWIAGSLIGY